MKRFFANRAWQYAFRFEFSRSSFLTRAGTIEFSVWKMLHKPIFSRRTFTASGACNLYNHLIVIYQMSDDCKRKLLNIMNFTMVAAENLKRRCFGMEISENYTAVILERMQIAFSDIKIERLD